MLHSKTRESGTPRMHSFLILHSFLSTNLHISLEKISGFLISTPFGTVPYQLPGCEALHQRRSQPPHQGKIHLLACLQIHPKGIKHAYSSTRAFHRRSHKPGGELGLGKNALCPKGVDLSANRGQPLCDLLRASRGESSLGKSHQPRVSDRDEGRRSQWISTWRPIPPCPLESEEDDRSNRAA